MDSLPLQRVRATLAIRDAALAEARKQGEVLFQLLKKQAEATAPCLCELVSIDLSESFDIQLSVRCVFESYHSFTDHEQQLGDVLESNARMLLAYKNTIEESYGCAATLLF